MSASSKSATPAKDTDSRPDSQCDLVPLAVAIAVPLAARRSGRKVDQSRLWRWREMPPGDGSPPGTSGSQKAPPNLALKASSNATR